MSVEFEIGQWYKYRGMSVMVSPYRIEDSYDRRGELIFYIRLSFYHDNLWYSFDSMTINSDYHKSFYKAEKLIPPTYLLAKIDLISNKIDEEDRDYSLGVYSKGGLYKFWES